jgi:hypothetical protein
VSDFPVVSWQGIQADVFVHRVAVMVDREDPAKLPIKESKVEKVNFEKGP